MSQKQDLLLVGCGDLAQRLVPKLSHNDWQISGLRRSQTQLQGVQMFRGDAADTEILVPLIEKQPQHIVVSLAPGKGSSLSPRNKEFQLENYLNTYLRPAQNIATLAKKHSPKTHIIFVSSTSVYGQNSGELVDESSCTEPRRETAKILVQAEQAIATSGNPYSIVRLSGIYGPGRTRLLDKVAQGDFIAQEKSSWTNRIHSEDCASLLAHLIRHPEYGCTGAGVLIGTDCEAVLNIEVEKWLATQMGIAAPCCNRGASDLPSSTIEQYQASGKRCNNQKLRDSGFSFQYPTYKEGYREMLNTG